LPRLFQQSWPRRHRRLAGRLRAHADPHRRADRQGAVSGLRGDRPAPARLDAALAGGDVVIMPANAASARTWHWLLAAAPALVLILFFALPNALLLTVSFLKSDAQYLTGEATLENYAFVLSRRLYLDAIVRTFAIGIAVGVLDVVLAYPLAYFLVRTTSRWKGLLVALSLAPLLASVVVRTYGWYVILNRSGVANDALISLGLIEQRIAFMPSSGAIAVGLAHALLPYAVLSVMG